MFQRRRKQFSINHEDGFLLRFAPFIIYSVSSICIALAITIPPQTNNIGKATETIIINQQNHTNI